MSGFALHLVFSLCQNKENVTASEVLSELYKTISYRPGGGETICPRLSLKAAARQLRHGTDGQTDVRIAGSLIAPIRQGHNKSSDTITPKQTLKQIIFLDFAEGFVLIIPG